MHRMLEVLKPRQPHRELQGWQPRRCYQTVRDGSKNLCK
jgi:hypothetical protein